MGTMWCLCDPTPSSWCKMDALSTELRSEDPNQHLKNFLKLVDLLDLDVANKERTRLHRPPRSLNETPRQNSFTFCERVCPKPQPKALDTSFPKLEYETTWHHIRKEWRGLKMRSLNNEKKSMIEWRRSLNFLKNSQQDKKSVRSNGVVGEDMVEPNKSDLVGTLEEVDGKYKVENRTNNKLAGYTMEDLI
ncbi:hypothetical protein Tco_0493540 [Tanacetum coccineum]